MGGGELRRFANLAGAPTSLKGTIVNGGGKVGRVGGGLLTIGDCPASGILAGSSLVPDLVAGPRRCSSGGCRTPG